MELALNQKCCLTFGAAFPAGLPAAAVTCSEGQAMCMATSAAKFFVEGGGEAAATGGMMAPVLMIGGGVMSMWASYKMWGNKSNTGSGTREA